MSFCLNIELLVVDHVSGIPSLLAVRQGFVPMLVLLHGALLLSGLAHPMRPARITNIIYLDETGNL